MFIAQQFRYRFRILFLSCLAAPLALSQSGDLPSNLGLGLRDLVETSRALPVGSAMRGKSLSIDAATGKRQLLAKSKPNLVIDEQNRVLVTVLLDGTAPVEDVRVALGDLGVAIEAEDLTYRQGVMSVFLPLASAAGLARTAGVSAVKLSRRPRAHVGAVTSQGAVLLHADQVNASGINGQGITIGILSDSYNMLTALPTADEDVATGDLPNEGVAEGRPGMKFLSDGPDGIDGGTDEGRGMAQIIHDVAPNASLCFASFVFGPTSFARNIRRLRTDPQCAADIIVDDAAYLDEPIFSDGPIAQAVNDVVYSSTLAGKKVSYFSAAGNQGNTGYSSTLRFVDNTTARALANQPIDLSTIPARISTAGGFHNFNPDASSAPALSQAVTLGSVSSLDSTYVVLQWDDPFDMLPSGVTTDLNLLVFNSAGRFVASLSSYDNNFNTNEPVEISQLDGSGSYRFVIARTAQGGHLAGNLAYIVFLPTGSATFTADYPSASQPTVFGHAGAAGAQAVAAYVYDNGLVAGKATPELESYSSSGPVTVSFDRGGNRLTSPEVRQKPDFAAPDCVTTTFFFEPDANDPYFHFCGTSAAAPHAAAVAALLLQSAGGPGSLTNDQIRARLQASPPARDLDPFFSQASLNTPQGTVTVTASGDGSNASASNTSFFRATFVSPTEGQTIASLTIDLTGAGLSFDPDPQTGLPLTIGSSTPGLALTSALPSSRTSAITLTFSGFKSGSFLTFGIDRDLASSNSGGNSADLLAGATVAATLGNGTALKGTFVNKIGKGYSPLDGFGLIDALAAVTPQ